MNLEEKKVPVTAFLATAFLAATNYLAETPLIFTASIVGLASVIYTGRKLNKQFNVPMFYYRKDGPNYWSGALGGLIALIFSMYGAVQGFGDLAIPRFAAEISLGLIYVVLTGLLLTGSVLKDVEDGYIGLE